MIRFTMVLSLFLSLLLSGLPSFAQPDTLWTRTLGGSGEDAGRHVQQTADGGFIITGYTSTHGNGGYDLWLIKTDLNGYVEWHHTFGGSSTDRGYCVQQTEDLGYIVAGNTNQGELIKTDSNGEEEWMLEFADNTAKASSVQQTTDNEYIVTGSLLQYATERDVFIAKSDQNGNEVWYTIYDGDEMIDRAESVKQTDDGGYIVCGSTERLGYSFDILLIKTDSEGNEQWVRTYGGTGGENGYDVQLTSDGGYIIVGTMYGSTETGYGWLIKTDSDGNVLWDQTYGGNYWDTTRSVAQTQDNGYILCGSRGSPLENLQDLWVIKTDANGNELWSQTFGGDLNDEGECIVQAADSAIIVVGTTESNYEVPGDIWLLRIGDSTHQGATERDTILPVAYRIESIYPNPFNPIATITIHLPQPSPLYVSVFNTTGREVAVLANGQLAKGRQQFRFNSSGLSSGIYYVRAVTPSRMDEVRKVVLLK